MKSGRATIIWGYLAELVFVAVLYIVARVVWESSEIAVFLKDTAGEWAALTGTVFAASFAIWLTFVNIRASEFGDYLDSKDAIGVYSTAFVTAIVVQLGATVSLIIVRGTASEAVAHVSLCLLFYAGVNLLTLIRNATGLVGLYGAFKRGVRDYEKAKPEGAATGDTPVTRQNERAD